MYESYRKSPKPSKRQNKDGRAGSCTSMSKGDEFVCTLDTGHKGRHEAGVGDGTIVAHWNKEGASGKEWV